MRHLLCGLAAIAVLAGLGAPGCKKKTEEPAAPAGAEPAAPAAAAAAATAGGSPAAGPDACALLTADEIKAVVGLAVAESGHGPTEAPNVCEYKLDGPGQLLTTVYASSGKETFENAPGDPLSGVGDQAKWLEASGMLSVLRGETSFIVGVVMFDDTPAEKKLEQAKALAAKVLERL